MGGLFLVSGEPSSGNYLEGVVGALKEKSFREDVFAISSLKLKDHGVDVICDANRFATVGITQAMTNFLNYAKLFRLAISAIRKRKPKLVVLMDLPDFNFKLAKYLKGMEIPCIYYIAPQVWAWRRSRLELLRKYIDMTLVVFKFEEAFFNKNGVKCRYVGHPMVEIIKKSNPKDIRPELGIASSDILISLFPASRVSQFKFFRPLLIKASSLIHKKIGNSNKQCRFVLCLSANIPDSLANSYTNNGLIRVVKNNQYNLMKSSDLIITTCGTTTFEALLMSAPMISFYKLNPMVHFFLKKMLHFYVNYYSLPNLLADRYVVPELIQKNANPKNMSEIASSLILDGGLTKMKTHLEYLKNSFEQLETSRLVADEILEYF